jgi:hypothetical protein
MNRKIKKDSLAKLRDHNTAIWSWPEERWYILAEMDKVFG